MNDNLEKAGEVIGVMDLLRIQTPITDPEKFTQLCRRCNRRIHDDDFQEHVQLCP